MVQSLCDRPVCFSVIPLGPSWLLSGLGQLTCYTVIFGNGFVCLVTLTNPCGSHPHLYLVLPRVLHLGHLETL